MSRKEKPPAGCVLIGRWRIIEADLWDKDYLDLSGPAMIKIGADDQAADMLAAALNQRSPLLPRSC